MKKLIALLLVLVMAAAMIACESAPAATEPAATEPGATEPAATEPAASGEAGSVYYLNFKPEFDAALQQLAKDYTAETGVEVKVVTAERQHRRRYHLQHW